MVKNISAYLDLYSEVKELGAKDLELCMQCGTCSATCPLSQGNNPFPRKIYNYLQLGLRDSLLASTEPWLCYYCGECNTECPRGAEPAETMMAVRRWLTTQYDWTGLARKFYQSKVWEFGALAGVALFVVLLFVFFHGPMITEYVSVNTFAPVFWVEVGDLVLAGVLSLFLLSNAFRMHRYIMKGVHVPLSLYFTEAKSFIVHFATQKKWRKCGENNSRWLKHFLLVSGYLTMLTLIIVFLRWFQVDDSSWHFSSLFGYYATGVLLFITVEMFLSRRRKQEMMHRYSHTSDWLFLVLLFFTTLTGIMMHLFRIGGWPMGTYVIYVIHLAIAVPMLVVEVPFGKWSHLFYRPLAVFLTTIKEKALIPSVVNTKAIKDEVGDAFTACMHCGTCTTVCPTGFIGDYSPRLILRHIAIDRATTVGVDEASWPCVTCDLCTEQCPRGIGILDVIKYIRRRVVEANHMPKIFEKMISSLNREGNIWGAERQERLDWTGKINIPAYREEHEYCLFNCCTTTYDTSSHKGSEKAGIAVLRLLEHGAVSYGTLGTKESCCGDIADKTGAAEVMEDLVEKNTQMFLEANVRKILTVSPHCLNTFRKDYQELKEVEKIHYTELLDSLITSGDLIPVKKIDLKVTYHDPCYLGRYNAIYEAPRRILKAIPGLELVEMRNNMEQSFCCGGGGGGIWTGSSDKESLGEIRVQEAISTGAAVIATACPYCNRMLNDAVVKLGAQDKIKVQDVAELVCQSVELEKNKQGVK